MNSRYLSLIVIPFVAIWLGGCFTCPDVEGQHYLQIVVLDPQNTLPEYYSEPWDGVWREPGFVATFSDPNGVTWTTATQEVTVNQIESRWEFTFQLLSTRSPIPKINRIVIEDVDGMTLVDETLVQKTTKKNDSCGSYNVGRASVDLSKST